MKSILILKNPTDQITDIERFLASRGFHIKIVTKARDAIQFITDERPDYSFLSADLLPQQSSWLFGVLNQLTNVIIYVGRMTAKNLAVTRELNGSYLLQPPLNPLGLDQILRRIEREQNKQKKLTSRLDGAQLWIMSALADLSLKAVCIPGSTDSGKVEKVRMLTRMTCLRVQTAKLSGYFIMAYGQNRTLDASWMSHLRTQLENYLESFDEDFSLTAPNELVIEEVNFNDWTKAQAYFILSSIHQNAELVLAFFKDPKQKKITATPSARRGYVELGLNAIPEEKVDFDIYVYLPQNARFVLYNPRGENFSESKKNKLISQGINSVHISKRSLDVVRQYHAQKFIEESTQPFREVSPH
jgi:hypothetical protein